MKLTAKLILVAIVFAAAAATTQTSHAQDGLFFPWYNYNFRSYRANNPSLPYFALYPPVYYSQPVARPYGYSPFALPPGVPPVEKIPAPKDADKAKEIVNPFFKPDEPQENADDGKTASHPPVIRNPYFPSGDVAAQKRLLEIAY